jgi:hypothetical protein
LHPAVLKSAYAKRCISMAECIPDVTEVDYNGVDYSTQPNDRFLAIFEIMEFIKIIGADGVRLPKAVVSCWALQAISDSQHIGGHIHLGRFPITYCIFGIVELAFVSRDTASVLVVRHGVPPLR